MVKERWIPPQGLDESWRGIMPPQGARVSALFPPPAPPPPPPWDGQGLVGWNHRRKHSIEGVVDAGLDYQKRVRVNYDKILDATSKIGGFEGSNPIIARDIIFPSASDNFNDNNIDPALWDIFETAGGHANTDQIEQNQRIECIARSDGSPTWVGSGLVTDDRFKINEGIRIRVKMRFDNNNLAGGGKARECQLWLSPTKITTGQLYDDMPDWLRFEIYKTSTARSYRLHEVRGAGLNTIKTESGIPDTSVARDVEIFLDDTNVKVTIDGEVWQAETPHSLDIADWSNGLYVYLICTTNETALPIASYFDDLEIITTCYVRELGNILHEPGDSGKEFKVFFTGFPVHGQATSIFYAYSSDGKSWTLSDANPVIRGVVGGNSYQDPYVVKYGGTYYLFCEGGSTNSIIRRLDSPDCETWGNEITVLNKGAPGQWDDWLVGSPTIWIENGTWYLIYEGMEDGTHADVGLATANDGATFTRDASRGGVNTGKVFDRGAGGMWDDQELIPNDVYKDGNNYYLAYHGYDGTLYSGIGIARSTNKTSWTRLNNGNRITFDSEPATPSTVNRVQTAMLFPNNPRNWIYMSDDNPPNLGHTNGIYFGYLEEGEIVALGGKCKTDFADIRFTDDDKTTELDHWLEHKTNSVYADFWYEVKDSLEELDADIYIYYDNDDALTESNGADTFIIFRNCSGVIGADWTLRGTGTKEYVGGELHIKTTAVWGWARVSKAITTTNRAIDFRAKAAVEPANGQVISFGMSDEPWPPEKWYWQAYFYNDNNNLVLGTRIAGGWGGARDSTTATFATGTYYRFSARDKGTHIKVLWHNDLSHLIEFVQANRDAGNYDLDLGNAYTNDEAYFDDIRVRKYVDPEPRDTDWYEEETA